MQSSQRYFYVNSTEETEGNQETRGGAAFRNVCMFLCMLVCQYVHIGGREEWKEFPARFCVGGRIWSREQVTGCLGVTVKAQRRRRNKFHTTSTFHTLHAHACVCVCVSLLCLCFMAMRNLFSLWSTRATDEVTYAAFVFVSVVVCWSAVFQR